jgi:hypothetical protein
LHELHSGSDRVTTWIEWVHSHFIQGKKMTTASGFGEKWKQVQLIPTFEHELFFFFLLISPSYALAHELRSKRNLKKFNLPKDFDVVRATYKKIGSIYESTFEDWWQEGGYKLFELEGPSQKLSFNVDLNKSEQVILKEVAKLVKQAMQSRSKQKEGKISFLKNKLHASSINDRKNFIFIKATASFKQQRDVENWRVAVKARVLSKWIEGLTFESVPNATNLKARTFLGELGAKFIKEATYIAENAARLEFPSTKKLNTAMPLNYELIASILFQYKKCEEEMLERYKDEPEKLIREKYLLGIKRHFRKKRRVEKIVEKAVSTAVAKAVEEERDAQFKLAQRRSSSARR